MGKPFDTNRSGEIIGTSAAMRKVFETIKVDVRVIAATHRDLEAEVNKSAFRAESN